MRSFEKELEKFDGFETEYLKIICYDLSKDYSGDYRTYNYTRICTILEGEKSIKLDSNESFTYDSSKFLLLPPNSKVHMKINQETKAVVFELNDDLIKNVIKKTDIIQESKYEFNLQNRYFLGLNKNNVLENIQNISQASKNHNQNQKFLIDLYAQKLVFDLIQDKATHDILSYNNTHPVTTALKYINENINNNLSIKTISDFLYMSESNFSHMFKKTIGCNPSEYIREKRLELAKVYLRNESVTEVAYNLGYENISYFIKLFKNKYKMTPKQYQKQYLNKIQYFQT